MKTRILIADDHALFRTGLRLLISGQEDLEVVKEVADAAELIESLDFEVDVLLLDLSMPKGGGLTALRRALEIKPDLKILVLTMHDDRAHLRAAMKAGALGFVTKGAADTELLEAIRRVRSGERYVEVAMEVAPPRESAGGDAPPRGKALSVRETQVLAFVANGHTNREIGEQLGVSIKSVETYRTRLLEKLGLKTRAELVRYALAAGLVGGPANG